MAIRGVLAQLTVSDLSAAAAYYGLLFGRGPDENPMPGLLEWHFTDDAGVQVFADAERAGRCTAVFGETDLAAAVARFDEAGIEHGGVEDATSFQLVQVRDADGNLIVFTGPS